MTEGSIELEQPPNPKDILNQTIKETFRLEQRAGVALGARNADLFRELLVKRAKFIVDLPNKIESSLTQGNTFPEDELAELKDLSSMATKALDNETKTFALDVLLTRRGSQPGDPNYLEEIFERVYGTSKI